MIRPVSCSPGATVSTWPKWCPPIATVKGSPGTGSGIPQSRCGDRRPRLSSQSNLLYPQPNLLGIGLYRDASPRLQDQIRHDQVAGVAPPRFIWGHAPTVTDHIRRLRKPLPGTQRTLLRRRGHTLGRPPVQMQPHQRCSIYASSRSESADSTRSIQRLKPRPHPDKVTVFIHGVLSSPLACGSIHPVSTPSTQFAAVVEQSTNEIQLRWDNDH